MKTLKYIFVAMIFATLSLSTISCGNKSNKKPATHVHADGTVHEGEAHIEVSTSKQESVTVSEKDAVKQTHKHSEEHECSGECGGDHNHSHEGHSHEGHSHDHEGHIH